MFLFFFKEHILKVNPVVNIILLPMLVHCWDSDMGRPAWGLWGTEPSLRKGSAPFRREKKHALSAKSRGRVIPRLNLSLTPTFPHVNLSLEPTDVLFL